MSVPHILADESSAYYHAYVLAEMSVHQTRAHFRRKYNALVDNEQVLLQLSSSSGFSSVRPAPEAVGRAELFCCIVLLQ